MEKMKYILFQLERAPTTGQLHAQGVIVVSSSLRLAAMKKITTPTIHLEPARAWEAAKSYCRKSETRVEGTTPHEWGEDTTQGQRSDLASAASLVRQGASMKEVAELDPVVFVRAYKGLTALQSILHPPKAIDRKVGLFVGATETGKTRMVFDELINVYTVFDLKNPWFDGYQGEANVLLDECGPGMMNHNFLKRLLDRYPMTVPIKGGSVAWNASTVVMTSNVPLDEWYERLPYADLQALKRRVKIFEFPKDKELARAWISGSLIRPEKRERIVEVESEDDIPVVSTQDKTQDLYDICYVD